MVHYHIYFKEEFIFRYIVLFIKYKQTKNMKKIKCNGQSLRQIQKTQFDCVVTNEMNHQLHLGSEIATDNE